MNKPRIHFKHPVLHQQFHQRTLGEKAADRMAGVVGSWRFILIQGSIIFLVWIPFNAGLVLYQWIHLQHFDPYPFILLNLGLSLQAAFTGPVLQLSSNRQSLKDRALWEHTALQSDSNDKRMLVLMEGMVHLLMEAQGETSQIQSELEALRREHPASPKE